MHQDIYDSQIGIQRRQNELGVLHHKVYATQVWDLIHCARPCHCRDQWQEESHREAPFEDH